MKHKFLFFVLLCVCLNVVVKGQIAYDQVSGDTQIFPTENTKLAVNTNVLLAGESLRYKIHNLTSTNTPSALSKVAYVSLLGVRDSVIFEHKLKLDKGVAHGFFFIPTDLITGVYRLVGYTNFSLNNRENGITLEEIYIMNPFIKGKAFSTSEIDSTKNAHVISKNIPDEPQLTAHSDFSLETNKSSYELRERVSLSIKNLSGENAYGNFSLAVRKLDPIRISAPKKANKPHMDHSVNVFYLPELRGEIISGRVLTAKGEETVANQLIALSIPGKEYVFKTARTNKFGQFIISLDEPYETTNSIIQVVGEDREQFTIVLDKRKINLRPKALAARLLLDGGIKNWLQERSIQVQLQNAYFNDQSIIISGEDQNTPFYGTLGRTYILDDYTRFPSLRETFTEVISFARIRRKAGKEVFEVFDPYNPYKTGVFSSRPPLLLLDGNLVQDHDGVLGYSGNKIERVHVFPRPYRYNAEVFWGIIDISTKKGEFRSSLQGGFIQEFELERPLPNKRYSAPNHSGSALQRIPDYRTQLLWRPILNMVSKEQSIHFYTSDVHGKYRILLEGYTDDGRYIKEVQYFEVK